MIRPREGTELDGRWFSNFNWIRPDAEPFNRLAFTTILGFESANVAPEYVIQGIPPSAMQDVLSGITFGWLNNNCALAAQMLAGNGKLLVTTFRLSKYGSDAYSTTLLDTLIRYINAPQFQPQFRLEL
ncbi:MAG: hypothetical protein JOY93_10550 [Acidobacteriales bacterium]|nr:hypothetical protein [Terriglobales bacterium]